MALPSRAEMGTGDGHQAGLGDQLVAGGLEGAERAWHAACDVLCSMQHAACSMRLAQSQARRECALPLDFRCISLVGTDSSLTSHWPTCLAAVG